MPAISGNLFGILSRRLRLPDTHTRSLDGYTGIATGLLASAREYGESLPDRGTLIPLHLTQTDLAGLVSASRAEIINTFLLPRSASIPEKGNNTA